MRKYYSIKHLITPNGLIGFTALLFFIFPSFLSICSGQQTIASQNFNGLSSNMNTTTDMITSGMQLTNLGANNTDGEGMHFQTFWIDTRGETTGPVTMMDTEDFIGVNSFTGSNAPDVSANGVPFGAGTEHNFEFNDIDGLLNLTFSPVNMSAFNDIELSLNYWISDVGFEPEDNVSIKLTDGTNSVTLLMLLEPEMEAQSPGDNGNATEWNRFNTNIDQVITNNGLDKSKIQLILSVDTNGGTENVFFDDIRFTGNKILTPIPTLSQWGLMIFGLLVLNLGLFWMRKLSLN